MFKYLLFVVLIDSNGVSQNGIPYEQMHTVSNIAHNDRLSCLVEKGGHKDIEGAMLFFCGKDTEYFNKEQKLY